MTLFFVIKFFFHIDISFQPPFEENGVASPIDGQKFNAATSLGTSIDSAMVTATNTFAKNRFLSGDHVNANHRDALLRRQLFAIGKWQYIWLCVGMDQVLQNKIYNFFFF